MRKKSKHVAIRTRHWLGIAAWLLDILLCLAERTVCQRSDVTNWQNKRLGYPLQSTHTRTINDYTNHQSRPETALIPPTSTHLGSAVNEFVDRNRNSLQSCNGCLGQISGTRKNHASMTLGPNLSFELGWCQICCFNVAATATNSVQAALPTRHRGGQTEPDRLRLPRDKNHKLDERRVAMLEAGPGHGTTNLATSRNVHIPDSSNYSRRKLKALLWRKQTILLQRAD